MSILLQRELNFAMHEFTSCRQIACFNLAQMVLFQERFFATV